MFPLNYIPYYRAIGSAARTAGQDVTYGAGYAAGRAVDDVTGIAGSAKIITFAVLGIGGALALAALIKAVK